MHWKIRNGFRLGTGCLGQGDGGQVELTGTCGQAGRAQVELHKGASSVLLSARFPAPRMLLVIVSSHEIGLDQFCSKCKSK